jgi:hypothetical protein
LRLRLRGEERREKGEGRGERLNFYLIYLFPDGDIIEFPE